jgi:hypothetical protein
MINTRRTPYLWISSIVLGEWTRLPQALEQGARDNGGENLLQTQQDEDETYRAEATARGKGYEMHSRSFPEECQEGAPSNLVVCALI